jgi:hypothetical protein
MTSAEWAALSPREKDREVADASGWLVSAGLTRMRRNLPGTPRFSMPAPPNARRLAPASGDWRTTDQAIKKQGASGLGVCAGVAHWRRSSAYWVFAPRWSRRLAVFAS